MQDPDHPTAATPADDSPADGTSAAPAPEAYTPPPAPPAMPLSAAPLPAAPLPAAPRTLPQKAPIFAGFLSVVPGLGNIYNGLYQRGIAFFIIYVSIFAMTVNIDGGDDSDLAILIPCLMFFWLFNIFDAYRQATLINYGYVGGAEPDKAVAEPLSMALIPGVALVAIGLYGLLREHFDFDLRWLVDQWPVFLILFGATLIWQGYKARQDDARQDDATGIADSGS
jgi:hypothetical protein